MHGAITLLSLTFSRSGAYSTPNILLVHNLSFTWPVFRNGGKRVRSEWPLSIARYKGDKKV